MLVSGEIILGGGGLHSEAHTGFYNMSQLQIFSEAIHSQCFEKKEPRFFGFGHKSLCVTFGDTPFKSYIKLEINPIRSLNILKISLKANHGHVKLELSLNRIYFSK